MEYGESGESLTAAGEQTEAEPQSAETPPETKKPCVGCFGSALVGKSLESQLVVLGSMSLGGNIVPVENIAESLQVAAEAGAKRLLLPMASVGDIPTIPGELFAKFQTSFYADPKDAVFKALGVQ